MTSYFLFLIKAWLIGIAIAAPVGPIGMLCIRKTLEFGFFGAVAVGIGAAFADGVYGAIAATGLSVITQFLLKQAVILKIFGGLFLLILAYKEFKRALCLNPATAKNVASFKLAIEVFFLTLSNPMTIIAFISIFASLNTGPTSAFEAVSMVLGIILGSLTWWFILGGAVVKIKNKLPEKWLYRIKYITSIVLSGFGVIAVISGLKNIN